MRGIFKRSVLLMALTLFLGCQNKNNDARFGIDPTLDHLASPHVAESFRAEPDKISIKKSALDKDFLFQANMITLRDAVQFSGKKSRVVYFSKKGSKVYMMESLAGNMVSRDYAAQLPLMEFDILSETKDEMVLDFNKGLSILYYTGDWFTHDNGVKNYEKEQPVTKVALSYIDSASLEQNESLVIKQIARVETEFPIRISKNIEVRYYISPYRPDPLFEPTESNSIDKFGYFEANPILMEGGETRVNASKWNSSKPIVYAISSNTPKEYREAIRQGILYWDKILGGHHISVVDAPEGITAPDFNYNVVQWINNDEAAFAYADAQMDPRSGEILHAQVYLTSVFAMSSREKIRSILRKTGERIDKKGVEIGLRGFEDNEICKMQNKEVLNKFKSLLLRPDITDERILQISQDFITSVVAHEVGHTLGLRHNFAGSLGVNVSLSEQKNIFIQYVKSEELPQSFKASSSVMDYLDPEPFSMIGSGIRLGYEPLEYDTKAIEHLYHKKEFKSQEVPVFCTDSHVEKLADCDRFDDGNSIVDYAKFGVEDAIENIPSKVLEGLIQWKADGQRHEKHMLSSFEEPSELASEILHVQEPLLHMLQAKFLLAKVLNQFEYINFFNQDEVMIRQDQYLSSEIEKNGGLEGVLFLTKLDKTEFVNQQSEKFHNLIISGRYSQGLTKREETFQFNQEDLLSLENYTRVYFAKLFDELQEQQITELKKLLSEVREGALLSQTVVNFLEEIEKKILFSEKPQKLTYEFVLTKKASETAETDTSQNKEQIKVAVQIPDYVYPLKVRILAASLLNSSGKGDITLGLLEKERMKKLFQQAEDAILKPLEAYSEAYELKQSLQSKDVLKWLLEYQKVKSAL